VPIRKDMQVWHKLILSIAIFSNCSKIV